MTPLQLFHPLLLGVVVGWLLARHVPALRDAGRARLVLLAMLVTGLVLVQTARFHRSAYPLSTWAMYSSPQPSPVVWEFRIIDEHGSRHFPWSTVAPVATAFHYGMSLRAARVTDATDPAMRSTAEGELSTILAALARAYRQHGDGESVEGVEVWRCRFNPVAPRHAGRSCDAVLAIDLNSDAP